MVLVIYVSPVGRAYQKYPGGRRLLRWSPSGVSGDILRGDGWVSPVQLPGGGSRDTSGDKQKTPTLSSQ